MNTQSDTNQPRFFNKTERKIKTNKPELMQWVKTYATATWIVYWFSQQMIDINQHGCNHNQVGKQPLFSKE